MSGTDGRHGRSDSDAARALWLLFWVFRNVVVFAFLAFPATSALVDLASISSGFPRVSVTERLIGGIVTFSVFVLPMLVPHAAAFSAGVVGLSFVLSGKRLRLVVMAALWLLGLSLALGYLALSAIVDRAAWSLFDVAPTCVFLACCAAYGWFCAIPPRAVGARARWEAVVANGAFVVSLAVPVVIALLLAEATISR